MTTTHLLGELKLSYSVSSANKNAGRLPLSSLTVGMQAGSGTLETAWQFLQSQAQLTIM